MLYDFKIKLRQNLIKMFLNIESHHFEMHKFEIIFCVWFKGPLTDLFKPLLRKILT